MRWGHTINLLSFDPGSVGVGWCCWQHGNVWAVGLIELDEDDRVAQLCRELQLFEEGLRSADVVPHHVVVEQACGYHSYNHRRNTKSLGKFFEAAGALRGYWAARGIPVHVMPADHSRGAKRLHELECKSLCVDLSPWPATKRHHVADAVSIGSSWLARMKTLQEKETT